MGEFTNPLVLVSPPMTGDRVRDCQWLLAGHSRFKDIATYKDGQLDGIYGPQTATAAQRAKWWLGYPDKACDKVFGQTLYEYLRPNKWRPLPADYRTRRAARLKAAQKTFGQKALDEAAKYLGVKESPFGSNCQQFGREYGFNCVPWCAIFVSCICRHVAGSWVFRYSYVPDIYYDAARGRNHLRIVWTPRAGDLALWRVGNDPLGHVSFVREPPSRGWFTDLGGNTGPSNVSNGGEVLSQRCATAQIHSWVRIDR